MLSDSSKTDILLLLICGIAALTFGLVAYILDSVRVVLQSAGIDLFVPTLIGLFCLVLVIVVLIVNRLAVRPVRQIESAMAEFGEDAKRGLSGDTVRDFIASLHSMAGELEKKRDDLHAEKERNKTCAEDLKRADANLEELNADLESIVSARTKELRQAKDEAETANRAKSEFLATVSHEIRTPMNAIIGLTDAALKTELTEKQRQLLDQVVSSGQGLLTIINDILDMSAIESGKINLEMSDFSLENIIENVEMRHADKASEKEICITVSIDPDIPKILVGDPRRLNTVLGHLVGNAVKFTEHGGIVIKASQKEITSDRIQIEFCVEDTGVGIRKDQLPALFSAFTQGDGSSSRRYGGAGLGLTLCKHLVELMRGRIWAESDPETGSVFFFTADFGLSDAESVREPAFPPIGIIESARARPLEGSRILLADDSSIDLQIVAEILKNAGSAIDMVSTGTEAVKAVRDKTFDAIVMDVEMPELNGTGAASLIRKWEAENSAQSNVPIIALTAHDLEEERERILNSGMNGFLAKPIDNEKLVTVLAKWVGFVKRTRKSDPFQKKGKGYPTIPGIDMESGIERVRGNAKLYEKLLTEFHAQYIDVTERIRTHFENGEMESARKLAHTVKGMAGNLSAFNTQKSALALEQAIRQGKTGEFGETIAELDRSLEEAFASIERLGLDKSEDRSGIESEPETSPSNMQTALGELDELIEKRNPDAETHLQSVKDCFGSDVANQLAELERLLSRFDFRKAKHVIREIASVSNIRLS